MEWGDMEENSPRMDLLSRSRLRGGVHWWPPDDALDAIAWYRAAGIAVVGADLAYLRAGATQATGQYFDASTPAAPPPIGRPTLNTAPIGPSPSSRRTGRTRMRTSIWSR